MMYKQDSIDIIKTVYRDIFGHEGRNFGSNVHGYFGVSEHNKGVQWNIVLDKNNNETFISINLEGLQYSDWPIAHYIENELIDLKLLEIANDYNETKYPILGPVNTN